jgi:SAM-dependent methyltransferase
MINRHWLVFDEDITKTVSMKKRFDAITCISVLEHISNHRAAMENMWRLLKPNGVLILTCPFQHNIYSPNVYKRADALYGRTAPYICQSFSGAELSQWLGVGFALERQALWKLFTGPVWATGERTDWTLAATNAEPHQLGCFLLRRCE